MTRKVVMIVSVLLILPLLITGCAANNSAEDVVQCKARVLSVTVNEIGTAESGDVYTQQILCVQPLDGEYEGLLFETEVSYQTPNNQNLALYRPGDRVLLDIYPGVEDQDMYVSIHSLIRAPYVAALVVFFLVLIGVIGKRKGLKTIVSLSFTVGAVILVLIPAIASGKDPVLYTIMVSILISVFTLVVVCGWNKKALAAILGTISGLCCAGLITMVANAFIRISAIQLEDIEMLVVSGSNFTFNLSGLITAAILISCLGAVMDVSTSISSVVNEVFETDPSLSRRALLGSGMSVGRDIMGTMANTLILAYTGGALILIVTWSVYHVSFLDMMNVDYIVVEIVKVICGSIGMILTIPFTAWIASFLIKSKWGIKRRRFQRITRKSEAVGEE